MAANSQWYYCKADTQYGPVSSAELKHLAKSGEVLPSDLVWKAGMTDWKSADAFPKLFASDANPRNPATPPPIPVTRPDDRAAIPVQENLSSSIPDSTALNLLRSKWKAVYPDDLSPSEILIAEAFTQLVPCDNCLYRYPDLPPKKLANAKKKYANLPESERILGLFDDTLFGTATDGCLMTTRGIYWHNVSEQRRNCDYIRIAAKDVILQKVVMLRKRVKISSDDYCDLNMGGDPVKSGIADFVRFAAAMAVASGDLIMFADKPSAQQVLSGILSQGTLNATLVDAIRAVVSLPNLTVDCTASTMTMVSNDVLSGPPQISQESSSQSFLRTKEDLALLQSDIRVWFETKNFAVTLQNEGSVYFVVAVKESLLRSIGGNRQKWVVKIEQDVTEYTVTLGWGRLEEKGLGGMAMTALANIYTLGAPAIAGQVEANFVQTAFWEWLHNRSSNVCPECQRSDAKQGPRPKTLDVTTDEEEFYDEEYEVTTRKFISEFSCRFCPAIWTEGDPWTTKTFEWDCPDCDHSGDYDCATLDHKNEIVCQGCGVCFWTDAQEEFQQEQQTARNAALGAATQFLNSATSRMNEASRRVCPWCGGPVLGGVMGKIARESTTAFSKCRRCGKTLPD